VPSAAHDVSCYSSSDFNVERILAPTARCINYSREICARCTAHKECRRAPTTQFAPGRVWQGQRASVVGCHVMLIATAYLRAPSVARPYLLGVISSEDIDTYTPNVESLPFRDHTTSLFKSRTESLSFSTSTSSENPSAYLHESSSDELSPSPKFSNDTDLSPHPDEHQVQLDTNRSFVLYPIGEPLRSSCFVHSSHAIRLPCCCVHW
jgi:hypothetical protein